MESDPSKRDKPDLQHFYENVDETFSCHLCYFFFHHHYRLRRHLWRLFSPTTIGVVTITKFNLEQKCTARGMKLFKVELGDGHDTDGGGREEAPKMATETIMMVKEKVAKVTRKRFINIFVKMLQIRLVTF
jgi:hypothetical protein